MASVAQQLQEVRTALAPVAGPLAGLEARLLAQHALGISHEQLVREPQAPVAENAAALLQQLTARRVAREPLAQIVGTKDFWKDTFIVTRDVLTPRADSEVVIEMALKHGPTMDVACRVLDLGTGSGCLLLSLLREFPRAQGVAVDLSPEALAVARRNAGQLGLAARVAFHQGHWCNPLDRADKFAIVVTNPPYIARAEIAALDEDVKGYEPHLALDGGTDGLDCYRAIFNSIGQHLEADAIMLLEVGAGQHEDVAKLGMDAGLAFVEMGHDLAGIARVVVLKNQRKEESI